jgi:hypothetical protein
MNSTNSGFGKLSVGITCSPYAAGIPTAEEFKAAKIQNPAG